MHTIVLREEGRGGLRTFASAGAGSSAARHNALLMSITMRINRAVGLVLALVAFKFLFASAFDALESSFLVLLDTLRLGMEHGQETLKHMPSSPSPYEAR